MSNLSQVIAEDIQKNGPLRFDRFWDLALAHPEYGYYMTRDPLGCSGDFTTAPEISQMFGEMIGVWAVDMWEKLGRPHALNILECGAGRGTLMADLMRATRHVPEFHAAVNIHLLEISPVLMNMQGRALHQFNPAWHKSLDAVPVDVPLLIIGNEFLDALPARQFEYTADGWSERYVSADQKWFLQNIDGADLFDRLEEFTLRAKRSDVLELSPAREDFIDQICKMIKRTHGAALFIDYGHVKTALGDTVQAVKDHAFVNVLEDIGNADITSHVDFESLGKVVLTHGMQVFGPVEQGAFLYGLGIEQRAKALLERANEKQAEDIKSALSRLTAAGQMGKLFKVMGIAS